MQSEPRPFYDKREVGSYDMSSQAIQCSKWNGNKVKA